MAKLSTESYKGVRDFYPEDMAAQNHIFSVWKKVAESFGYEEYSASLLEPSELYKAKSGDEIVNEQTYTFRDRGDRDVTLRPEMTPTVARMVAARRRDLGFPLRWYSIPNLFRYEQPQRGRLREHWQLNVDIFGVTGIDADVEVVTISHEIMKAFGAKEKDFEILVNNRAFFDLICSELALDENQTKKISKLTDKMAKIDATEFTKLAEEVIGKEKAAAYHQILRTSNSEDLAKVNPKLEASPEFGEIKTLCTRLSAKGIKVKFSPSLMRGFDYYTGIVFEVFDTDPKNNRSMFGGGRYDDLLALFGGEKVAAFGFGMGDVTILNFLETHGLLTKYTASSDLRLCVLDEALFSKADELAMSLRANGVKVSVDFTGRKIADQIKAASKQGVPFITVMGADELASGTYEIKNLETGKATPVKTAEIAAVIKNR